MTKQTAPARPGQHTPGPWYAREWNTHDKTTVLANAPETFLKVRQIAECEEEDDARLIAAAPDMLDALRDVLAGHNDPELFLPQVRAAIRKATGGA